MFDPDAYRLSEKQLNTIFTDDILPDLFNACTASSDDPVLVLIGGQPGAGKSRACSLVRRTQDAPLIEIVGDDLRPYHPSYRHLLTLSPSAMPDGTAQALGAWVERAIDYAASNQISVIVEGTFRTPTVPVETAQRFRQRGFRVVVFLLAVAPEVSHLSIADRFVTGMSHHGTARFTSVDAHNAAFEALPDTMRVLYQSPALFSRFVVLGRDGRSFYDNGRDPSDINALLDVASREWFHRSMGIAEFASWRRRADAVSQYFGSHYSTDAAVRRLLTQLDLDRKFLHLVENTPAGTPVSRTVHRGKLLPNGEVIEPWIE